VPDRLAPEDRRWLARAIALAETARVISSPNPGVGCVLVHGDRIAGEGATRPTGGPHAEAVALAEAGATAAGATAYVTLEPCAHHGRTPPCADALVAAGVRRVVIAHPDPNSLARGGARVLTDADVEVVGPLDADDLYRRTVAAQLEGFLTTVVDGRPHITLKVAQTTDGKLTAPEGRWVTGPLARRAVHRWRASVDAVMVGVGTVLADDPRLDVRDVPASHQPRAVVVDSQLSTPPGSAVVRPGTLVITTERADEQRTQLLRRAGVDIQVVAADPAGRVALPSAAAALVRWGITSVLAEPGATLARALLDADLVERLVVHVADHGTGTFVVPALIPAPQTRWQVERFGGIGPDAVIHLRRVRQHRSEEKST
jgi:diaminohydroxyphosphoribosylaminopyrimidine deaminase / 5-amino-6-(5-phosphoribosylamino)uracil reductase